MIVTDGSSGCSAESEDDMRIVDVAVQQGEPVFLSGLPGRAVHSLERAEKTDGV